MDNRLVHFLGKPLTFNNFKINPPTINSISEIGEINYSLYTTLASFDKETVLKTIFGVSDKDYESVEHEDDFDVLTMNGNALTKIIEKAISFFIDKDVVFMLYLRSFVVFNDELENGYELVINKDNYVQFSKLIKEMNCVSDEKEAEIKFKNDRAREMYKELKKFKKNKTDDSLGIKDILSILCNVEGNGINVFNVGNLTIYQMYEQFERVNIKENHRRLLKVWANGYLGEKNKLPEWIIKSKL